MRGFLLHVLPLAAALFSASSSLAQKADPARWMEYMREPNANYFKVKRAFDAYWKDSIPERGHGYKAFKRWEWHVWNAVDSQGFVRWPEGRLQELVNTVNDMETHAAPCPANGRWQPVGPVNHPWNQSGQPTGIGRINGIAFHPKDSNTFFACAPQGGVWKTTDHGKTWQHLFRSESGFNTIGASCMAISPNNPDTMYVGTGDRDAGDAPGYGVLASWNGGKNWVLRNSGMGNVLVGRIVMHPRNAAILLAATNNGIYRSVNSGATWSLAQSGGTWDLIFNPHNPAIVYATIGGQFYRSTNSGQSFTLITAGLPTSGISRAQLAVTAAGRGYVYMMITPGSNFLGMYRSLDSGLNFSTMSTAPNIMGYYDGTAGTGDLTNGQGWYDMDLSADPKNKDIIYAAGINVWRSTNGGSTWTQIAHWYGGFNADDVHADQHASEFNITGNTLFSGNDGGIYFTRNPKAATSAIRWTNSSTGIQNSQIYRLSQAQTNEYAGAHGYQDNGSSQTERDEFITYYGGDGMDNQVDPKDHRYMYGSYVYGRIYRAFDRNSIATIGANGTGGINEGGNWLTPFILQEANAGTMFAGYSNVWRTTAAKTGNPPTWTRISTNFAGVRHLENSPAKNSILYVLQNSNNMQRSDNANATAPTFTNLGAGPTGVRWIEAHPTDTNRVYCINASNLYRSKDKGLNWTSLASLNFAAHGNLRCIFFDSSANYETIYVGSERGVYVWDSLAGSLINYNTGFPIWADVTDLDIYYSSRGPAFNRIVASTYGRGVWRSNPYEPGVLKPVAGMYGFDSVCTVGGKLRLKEQVQNSASSLSWRITPFGGCRYAEGTDSTQAQPVLEFLKPGLYSVRLVVSNCQGSDTAVKANWIRVFRKSANAVCTNTTTFRTGNSAIGLFRISMSDNTSETGGYFDDGEYLDRSADKVFRLKPSTTYQVKVKTGPYNNEFFRLFIDYNNNGRFESWRGEAVINGTAVLGERTLSFTTPSGLLKNNGLRMRAISDFNALDTNACRLLGYGQGEDFAIVYDKPVPDFLASRLSICQYQSVVFRDTSDGMIANWQWDFGAGAVPAKASGKGPFRVYYTTPGMKTVKLFINGNDSLVRNAWLEVGRRPQSKLQSISANPLCELTTLKLLATDSVRIAGTNWAWFKDGVQISGEKDSFFIRNSPVLKDSGIYHAVITQNGCSDTTNAISKVMRARPQASFTVNQPAQCRNINRFVLTGTSSISAGSITAYNWNFGDSSSAASPNSVKTYKFYGNRRVWYRVESNYGCRDSVFKDLVVYPDARASFSVNKGQQCFAGHQFAFKNLSSVPAGGLTYLWSFGDGNNSAVPNPTKTYSSDGVYRVLLQANTVNGCKDTLSMPVSVFPQPSAVFSLPSSAQCMNGHVFLPQSASSVSKGSIRHLWFRGDGKTDTLVAPQIRYAQPGNYNLKLRITSDKGCMDSAQRSIVVYQSPKAGFTVSKSDGCEGDTISFTSNSSIAAGTLTLLWNLDGTLAIGNPVRRSWNKFGVKPIRLIARSSDACDDTFTLNYKLHALPLNGFTIAPQPGCAVNTLFRFNASASSPDNLPYSINWDFGDGGTSGGSQVQHRYNTAGNYNIRQTVSTQYCQSKLLKPISVLPEVSAAFVQNNLSRERLRFVALDTLISGYSYEWLAGDGNFGAGKQYVHTYDRNGKYPVQLIVDNRQGCVDTSLYEISLNSPNLKEQSNSFDFYLYPNPTANRFTYKFRLDQQADVRVELFDMLGQDPIWARSWLQAPKGTSYEEVDLKRLRISGGTYVLKIRSGVTEEQVKLIFTP